MYSTATIASASTIPHGIVRSGRFTSSATFSMSSNPMKEKNVRTEPASNIDAPRPWLTS